MDIANQILNIRKEQKLTQAEFGRLFYVTRQTVSNWENGKINRRFLYRSRNRNRLFLFIFSYFDNSNCGNYGWTCNDRGWLV